MPRAKNAPALLLPFAIRGSRSRPPMPPTWRRPYQQVHWATTSRPFMRDDSMFQKLPEAADAVLVHVEGRAIRVPAGASAAAAALIAGLVSTRTSPATNEPRAPYCMMGVCFECLLEIDGLQNRQACLTTVREGMKIRTQMGARMLAAGGVVDAG